MDRPLDGKKLFMVEIERTIVVLAASRQEAEAVAADSAHRFEVNDEEATYDAWECDDLPAGWETSLPYGGDDKQTCEEIQGILDEYERTRPLTKAEMEALGQLPLIERPGV